MFLPLGKEIVYFSFGYGAGNGGIARNNNREAVGTLDRFSAPAAGELSQLASTKEGSNNSSPSDCASLSKFMTALSYLYFGGANLPGLNIQGRLSVSARAVLASSSIERRRQTQLLT